MYRLLNIKSQAVLSAFCLPPLINGGCIPESNCKAYPGSSDWPSQDIWNGLNSTVEGRLLQPTPPGAVCHEGWPTYDPEQCPAVASNWSVYEFHTNDPISVMWDQYTNDTCLAKPEFPCSATGYPAYVVNATTPEHIKAGLDFARSNNVRLVVKNTGHDYVGRSTAPGALSIWTHHLNSILIHKDEFKLDGCDITIDGPAVTVGAGAQMWDVYSATDAINQTIVGGGGKSVGVGGFITGGGHSILAPRYGLAADQVLQMEMVTPGGDIITINEKQHSDLFWAMRGGGGSTFGVLTSITLKTHPTPKILSSSIILLTDADSPIVFDLITYSMSSLPKLGELGFSGYTYNPTRFPNPVPAPGAPAEVAGVVGIFILQDTHDLGALSDVLTSINETVQQRWQGAVQFLAMPKTYDSFLGWFGDNYDKGAAGNDSYLASRLLNNDALQSKDLKEAVRSVTSVTDGLSAFLVSGKGVHEAVPRGGSNAVNPAWRRSYVHAVTGLTFPPLNQTAKNEAITNLDNALEPLRKLTPNTGAYINEAFPFEKDWQRTFWGENYDRLLSIKRQIDPLDVLWCHPCVGSERLQQRENGRLCKV